MRPSLSSLVDEFKKIASEEEGKSPGLEMAKILGSGALGFGAGTAAGLGAGWLANKATKAVTGSELPKNTVLLAAPLLGTGAAVAYSIHKAREQEALRRVLEDQANPRRS